MLKAEEKLKNFAFWDKLTENEKELVRKGMVVKKFSKGQLIHRCCGDCIGMILLLKGAVRTYLLSEEGREVTLFRLYENDPCVLSAACVIKQITFETNMEAEEDCEILVISALAVSKLIEENINVRCFVYEIATERFSAAMKSMQQILFMKFERRLALFLIEEIDRTGKTDLHMTHEQIAQFTSSAREVVARMLKRFVDEGYVELKRGHIYIINPDGLRKLLK